MDARWAGILAAVLAVSDAACSDESGGARNVILFIGDGMGPEQVRAARLYHGKPLPFERLPYRSQVATGSADSKVTDSAAAATAIATGVKVANGVISRAIPGDGHELPTLLELFRDQGRRTGLVTTTPITHATPAAFGAHEASRGSGEAIARDLLEQTRPHVLMGGGAEGMSVTAARAAGYTVVTNGAGLKELDLERQTLVCGPFGPGSVPPLSEMTAAGLHVLDNDRDGFFLMVEGGDIDGACHGQNLERCVGETVGFGRAVQAALEWALGRTDTVIIVTADHETGGLAVTADTGAGKLPEVRWSSTGHTAAPVGVYAWGTHAAGATNLHDNTDIFRFIRSVALPPAAAAAR